MKAQHLYALATLTLAIGAQAQMSNMPMSAASTASAAAAKGGKLTEGEALKVDQAAGKVTLRHGPIENLGMPGMTMVFPVADQKMLAGIQDGDPVRFRAEKVNGATVVTRIEPAR